MEQQYEVVDQYGNNPGGEKQVENADNFWNGPGNVEQLVSENISKLNELRAARDTAQQDLDQIHSATQNKIQLIIEEAKTTTQNALKNLTSTCDDYNSAYDAFVKTGWSSPRALKLIGHERVKPKIAGANRRKPKPAEEFREGQEQ